ncbi:ankyrin repeat-containing domain protein [Ilyonectria destructans]|nr:ankyrin repeat-containing domain protein [Ilyonectria destructans]
MTPARRVPATEWDAHTVQIHTLYVVENKTLAETMTRMKEEHGFLATKAQYVRKLKDWGIEKNSTSEQWKHATDLKLKKEFSRYGYLQNRVGIPTVPIEPLLLVVARTPPSIQSVAVFLSTTPWLHFETLAEELLLPLRDSLMNRSGQALASGGHNHQIHSLREILDDHKGKPRLPLRLEEKLSVWRENEKTKQLIQSEPLLHLLRCIIYMSSNALTSDKTATNLLRWADQHGITWAIKGLIQVEGLTMELLSSKLLYASVKLNNISLTRALLARGADPNRLSTDASAETRQGSGIGHDQITPLFFAVQKQQTELVKLLLNYGANPHMIVPDGDGISTALQFALEREGGEPQIAKMLIKAATEATHSWSIPTHALLPAAVKGGSITLVELLLEAGVPLDERKWLDCAPQAAARWNKFDIARLLLRWKVDANCPGAYVYMGGRTEIPRCLYDSGHIPPLQLYFSRHASDLTPLQFVTGRGNVQMAELLIQCGADVNGMMTWDVVCPILKGDVDELLRQARFFWQSSQSKPALIVAAANGRLEMAELLLKAGAEVNGRDIQTPLTVACESLKPNRMEMVKLLLRWGANINVPAGRSYGGTALQNAVESKDIDLVNLLLDNGADVNAAAPMSPFRNALGLAIFSDNMEMAKLLLDAGADPSHQDAVMSAVVRKNSFEYVSLLLKYGASVSGHCFEHLLLVLVLRCDGDYDTARLLVDAGAIVEVHGDDENVDTPLKVAVEKNFPEFVHLFLENGADVGRLRCMPKGVRSYLHLDHDKERQCKAEIIRALIDHGIDVNLGQNDETVLQAAIESQDLELVRLLLHRGADPNQSTGCPPLVAALVSANEDFGLEAARALISHGARVNGYTYDKVGLLIGGTKNFCFPFHSAHSSGFRDSRTFRATPIQVISISGIERAVQLLITEGADLNAPASEGFGCTALQGAILYGKGSIVKILLAARADINAPSSSEVGVTALQAAIETGNNELIKTLLDSGANIHAPAASFGGATAIQAAALEGNSQLVQDLLVRGADVNAPPGVDWGLTALQYAAIRGDLDMVVQLLEYGADVNAKAAARSWTALEGAAKCGRLDIVHILLENAGRAEFLEERCEKAAKLADEKGHKIIGRVLRKWKSV